MDNKTIHLHMLSYKRLTSDQKTHRLKVKWWKLYFMKMETNKKARVAILILDKIDFKTMVKKGPSNSTAGYLSEETQNTGWKRQCICIFIAALFTIVKMESSKCLSTEKQWCIYTMKYDSALKKIKNETSPCATVWMNLESPVLSEISQTGKDKYCKISLTCGT